MKDRSDDPCRTMSERSYHGATSRSFCSDRCNCQTTCRVQLKSLILGRSYGEIRNQREKKRINVYYQPSLWESDKVVCVNIDSIKYKIFRQRNRKRRAYTMHACMYVCMYICIYVCTYALTYMHVCVCIYIYIYKQTDKQADTSMDR